MFSPEFQVKQKFPLVQGQSSFEIVTLYISFFVLELNVICNNDSKIISPKVTPPVNCTSDYFWWLHFSDKFVIVTAQRLDRYAGKTFFCYLYSSHYWRLSRRKDGEKEAASSSFWRYSKETLMATHWRQLDSLSPALSCQGSSFSETGINS